MLYIKIKPFLDSLFSIVVLIFLCPLFILLAFLVYINMGWPIFFCQLRPGLNGKLFKMYKFRTMRMLHPGSAISDGERITNFGRFLRAYSLDELPEFLNVIKGDMSLIGPRPLLEEYLVKYTATQMRRHEVLPGISGLAQVKGRNNLTWNSKFRYDVFYVDHVSFRIDFMIFIATVKVVLSRSGFRSHGEAKKFGK
jgi:lipopolysaccharide/colanic/teichoic acid biosynthesis glycosyltransferase